MTARNDLSALDHVIAGGVSGSVNRMIIAPLDLVKVRLQSQSVCHTNHHFYSSTINAVRTIMHNEGIFGFWKGNVAAQIMSSIYTATAFLTFHGCRKFAQSMRHDFSPSDKRAGPLVSVVSGSVSGFSATIVSYPFDLLRTRFAVQHERFVYRSLYHACSTIFAHQGVHGFFKGMSPTLVAVVPNIALQFTVYNGLMNACGSSDNNTSLCGPFACGMVAGVVAKFLTMPLDVLKKRFQIHGFDGRASHAQHHSMVSMARHILHTDGVAALFRGTTITILKAAPSTAITFSVYEMCADYFARTRSCE